MYHSDSVAVISRVAFFPQPFHKLCSILFSFLVSPEQVRLPHHKLFKYYPLFHLSQSSQLLSELEEFASQFSLGLSALKNLVKSILIVSHTLSTIQHFKCIWVNNFLFPKTTVVQDPGNESVFAQVLKWLQGQQNTPRQSLCYFIGTQPHCVLCQARAALLAGQNHACKAMLSLTRAHTCTCI